MLALRHASLAQPHLGLPAAEAHRDGPTVWAGLNSKFVKNEIPQLDKEITGKLNDLDHHRKLLVKALKDELEGKNKPRPMIADVMTFAAEHITTLDAVIKKVRRPLELHKEWMRGVAKDYERFEKQQVCTHARTHACTHARTHARTYVGAIGTHGGGRRRACSC